MPRRRRLTVALLAITVVAAPFLSAQVSSAQEAKKTSYDDPEKVTDPDYPLTGEYLGTLSLDSGEQQFGLQVIARGNGRFEVVRYQGGLPGQGWDREAPVRAQAEREGNRLRIAFQPGSAILEDGVITVLDGDQKQLGTLKKTERKSKTLGQKPPEKAIVLFDGSNVEQWENGRMTEDGLLMQGTSSRPKFKDHKLHIEFRLPYEPENEGQARANSGIYLQGRYEVQMLDSFGLEGKDNECGGLYSVKAPDLNMCYPPLTWQTYDIEYTAARYDEQGKLLADPRVTVYHNGELIHDDVVLPGERSTTAAPLGPGPEPGPVYLQDHGNPVRYRNIWVVERNESGEPTR